MNRYLNLILCALLTTSLGMSMIGCTTENKREQPPEEELEDVGLADVEIIADTEVSPPKDDTGSNPEIDVDTPVDAEDKTDVDDDESDAAIEVATPHQAHQLCAIAGRSGNDEALAAHCMGAHDLSGFQAQNEEGIWQPGAFQIFTK